MKASILRVVVYILLQTQLSVTWMSNSLLSMVGNSYDDQGRSLIPDSLLASHNNALLISIIYYLFILFIIIIYAWWTISVSEEWILVWLWGRSWDCPWILGWVLQIVTQHPARAEKCDLTTLTTPTLRTFALFMFTLVKLQLSATWPRWSFSAMLPPPGGIASVSASVEIQIC